MNLPEIWAVLLSQYSKRPPIFRYNLYYGSSFDRFFFRLFGDLLVQLIFTVYIDNPKILKVSISMICV